MLNADVSGERNIRYQTIENKRTSIYKALLRRPDDVLLKAKLQELSSPQQIRQAAKDGIFINYARSDEVFALELSMTLRKAGQKAWLDVLDVFGIDWRREVAHALNRCGLMVTIVSNHCLTDFESERERRYFMREGKIIVPIMYEKGLTSLPSYFVSPSSGVPAFGVENQYGVQGFLRVLSGGDAAEKTTSEKSTSSDPARSTNV